MIVLYSVMMIAKNLMNLLHQFKFWIREKFLFTSFIFHGRDLLYHNKMKNTGKK